MVAQPYVIEGWPYTLRLQPLRKIQEIPHYTFYMYKGESHDHPRQNTFDGRRG